MTRHPIPVLVIALTLAACSSPPVRDPAYAAARPKAPAPVAETSGGIYQPNVGIAMFQDQRAHRVGDILTVRLSESTNATKSAGTTLSKSETAEMAAPQIFGSPITFNTPGFIPLASNRNNTLAGSIDASRDFAGKGDSSQKNSLTGSISVTVVEVLPNGNLMVRGEKIIALNQGHEYVRLKGIVRPSDILPDNSVYSMQVADAQITYGGEGALSESNERGWLARLFSHPLWPF
jgi:flagellar L-ring protein precursor FlgH